MEACEPVKLLLIGDGTVGKSQLIIRFLASRFDPNFIVTIGVQCQYATVPLYGNLVRVQIWDAAGQEQFRTISPAYYAKAHGVMIVYDITNHSSFRNVEYWKQQVDAHSAHDDGDSTPIIVVGNKTDLVDEHTMSLRVSTDEEESLSDKLGVPFRPASAKKGNGVHEAFSELIDLAVQRHFSHDSSCFVKANLVRSSSVLSRARTSMAQHCRRSLGFSRSNTVSNQSVPKPQLSVGSTPPPHQLKKPDPRLSTGHGQSLAQASSGKDSAPRVEPVARQSVVCTNEFENGIAPDDRLIKLLPGEPVCSRPPAQMIHLPKAQAHAAKKAGVHLMPSSNYLLAFDAGRQSDAGAATFSLGHAGIPNLGLQEEVDNVEFDGDGGQVLLSPARAERSMTGIVNSPWVGCMNPCCQHDGPVRLHSPLKK